MSQAINIQFIVLLNYRVLLKTSPLLLLNNKILEKVLYPITKEIPKFKDRDLGESCFLFSFINAKIFLKQQLNIDYVESNQ
tara:strand:- start:220 stop:462 length:243 start_codon:yes stop_codon:yes gene_type:complete